MGLDFSEVSRKAVRAVGAVDPDHEAGFREALDYFRDSATNADLSCDFPSVKDRDAFVKYCRAMAESEGMRFRATVNEPGAARLVFRMETEAEYLQRKAKREAEIADREARRARGEVIKRGRKSTSAKPAETAK